MYSTYNEEKSVVAKRYIRALENKIAYDSFFKKCLY